MAGRKRRYKVNEEFFSSPLTPEAAYVMGFFLADGSYRINMVSGKWPSYSIAFAVHQRDEALLHKIRGVMDSQHPIGHRIAGGYSRYHQAHLYIHSKRLALDLLETWQIPRHKSDEARFPDLPTELESHLVRGYFDGDGHIGLYDHKDGWRNRMFSFCGGPIVPDIADTIFQHTGIEKPARFRERKSGSAWELTYGSRDRDVLLWIYKGATIYLGRKHEVALQFLRETDPDA